MSSFKILKIERSASDQVIELLDENIIGTPGESMLYKHRNVPEKIANTQDPYFANLSIRDRLYGTICLSKRNVFSFGQEHQAFYLRYFTFRESLRAKNSIGKSNTSESKIRQEVAMLMDGAGLDFDGDLVQYAYVDKDNIRSKRLIDEFGFQKMGEFNVIPFSRFFPKYNSQVDRLRKNQLDGMKSLLMDYYKKEQLVFLDNLGSEDNYFIIRKNNEIVCGVQAITDGWEIKELPGLSGKIMMNIVPILPVIGKLFNPQYNFVFLESIFCREGYHKELGILLESVLSHYQLYSGIICLDPKSQVYGNIKRVNLGYTHKIMGETKIDLVIKSPLMTRFNNKAPFFVSGHDVL